MALRSRSQDETTLPRRQTSAISARSSVEAFAFGHIRSGLAAQNIETLRIGLHEAILDSVVDHS